MSLDPSRQSQLHHTIVRLAIKGGLTRSIQTLESSIDEAVRSHLRWPHQGSARERLEVQVRELLRVGAGEGLPRPPILDWLGTASRLAADAAVSRHLLAIHAESCGVYGRPDLMLSDDDVDDEDEGDSLDLDEDDADLDEGEWDEDDDDEADEPERARDWVFAADQIMKPKGEVAEPFTLEAPAKVRLTVESDDLVTLAIVSEDDYRSWQKAFFRRDIMAASTWRRDKEMHIDGELVEFDEYDLPDGGADWRLVVRHVGTEAVHVKVEMTILY